MRIIRSSIGVVAVVSIVVYICSIVLNTDAEWIQPHVMGKPTLAFAGDRPECPIQWSGDTIPVLSRPKSHSVTWTVSKFAVPASGFTVSGPITDIPEFHDCQRFVQKDGKGYDPLFAVFAAYNLDAIMTGLAFDPVSWSSSNAAVASVNAAGRVSGIAPGNAMIVATSTVDPARKIVVRLIVGAAPAPDTTVKVMVGSVGLPNISIGGTLTLVPVLGPKTTSTLAAAEIYTFGAGYTPLGIGPNFSCLYIYFNSSNQLVGKMVAFGGALGSGTDQCMNEVNPNVASPLPEKMLTVVRTTAATSAGNPAAARWDFDPVNEKYYVGLKCGEGWCEVGEGTTDKPFVTSASLTTSAATPADQLVTMQGKGWYDQQELAGAKGNTATPSGLVGTIIPNPRLADFTMSTFKTKFTVVAYVGIEAKRGTTAEAAAAALKDYKAKFNYDPVPVDRRLDKLNTISICHGSRFHCGVPDRPGGILCGDKKDYYFWPSHTWVKIEAANGGRVLYRCGIRRDHSDSPGFDPSMIAATTRWRWLATDETAWDYCSAAGCCETGGDGVSPGW